MSQAIYWCESCETVIKVETEAGGKTAPCFRCGSDAKYLSTDVRPVFSRERRILQFYGHGPLLTELVWRSSKSPYYYINGKSASLPVSEQLQKDLPEIGDFIADSDHYDAVHEQLLEAYCGALEINRANRQ